MYDENDPVHKGIKEGYFKVSETGAITLDLMKYLECPKRKRDFQRLFKGTVERIG